MQGFLKKYKKIPIQAKASIWFLVCAFLQKGISVLSTPIFTRLMSSSEYGEFGSFNSWYNIIHVMVALNLASGVYTAAMVKFSEEKKKLASSYQGLTLFVCSVWFILYLLFREFCNDLLELTTVQVVGMFIMVWASAAFALWSVEQRVTYSYRKLVLLTIFVSIAKPLLGIFLVLQCDDKVTARILGLAAVELVGYTGVACYQLKRGKCFFSKKYWTYALRFNLPLVPHALSQTILSSADRIMIKSMIGNVQAGYYTLAYSVSVMMILFNTSLSQTLAPWTYKKIRDDRVEDINRIAIFTVGFIAVANLFLIAFAPEVIVIFAPKEYLDAVNIIPPVAISVYFMFLYDWFCRFEYYYEETIYILIASTAGAVLNVVLNYIFIPIYGYIAAGYTTMICYGVNSVLHYCFMRKICKKNLRGIIVYDMKRILMITIVFIVMGLGISITYENIVMRYALLGMLLLVFFYERAVLMRNMRELYFIRKAKTLK